MIRALHASDCHALHQNWQIARCSPDAITIEQLEALHWSPASVPGTVAANLNTDHSTSDANADDLDASEYWFRCSFDAEPGRQTLAFDGLATLAEVWLNGRLLLRTSNMFISHTTEAELTSTNLLAIRFPSLNEALKEKRPRAGWRTQIATHRNLRYIRTSLLGRMPGICPPVPPIGPWRAIYTVSPEAPKLIDSRITPKLNDQDQGVVDIELTFQDLSTVAIQSATALLGEHTVSLRITGSEESARLSGTVLIENPERWWPHTHGQPHLYPLTIRLQLENTEIDIPLPSVGFRTVCLTSDLAAFEIAVNDQPIHCRGAVWMPTDLISFGANVEKLRAILLRCRDAGMNMLRVSGTSAYECDQFYELCDEFGIMIWQDFMFARMDYPTEDPEFLQNIQIEADQFLSRIAHRSCLTVLCGGTEIRQQATMLGLPDSTADNVWFDEMLPALCAEHRPDVLYCPHSPMVGALPFHADAGIGHYFGIGAYLQGVDVAELEPPRFASECLAFATPAEPHALNDFQQTSGFDWPTYEKSIPRDNGADWSFADVTDHYLNNFFATDASALKSSHPSLYLDASRIAVAETMKRALESWRRNNTTTGALILTLNDLSAGNGWGVLDSDGKPKAPYYFLKRAWSPVALYFRDRRTNGLWLGMHNDSVDLVSGQLTIELANLNGKVLSAGSMDVSVDPAGKAEWSIDEMLGGFVDANYAYRFGPRAYDVAIATFQSERYAMVEYRTLTDRPLLPDEPLSPDVTITQTPHPQGVLLEISSDRFIDYLMLDVPEAELSDNYLTVVPGKPRTTVVRLEGRAPKNGSIRAFNSTYQLDIVVGGAT